MDNVRITVAQGDGIGPEIMSAVSAILKAAGARLDMETVELGEKVYNRGVDNGIDPEVWKSLKRTHVLLKGPITTPQGGGYKSLTFTLRAALHLFANVRHTVAYSPHVSTAHPKMDVVIVRENEEDLYSGIEYRPTHQMRESLKLMSDIGCDQVIRYAFEYACVNHRQKVTCMVKDNIMKFTDGLFHKRFEAIAAEYPGIASETLIVDIGAARLATVPEDFDVVVLPNLYGDILSDVTAELSGSVGMGSSVNVGPHYAMFEAVHGSAPNLAGRQVANPSGLLLAAVEMLVYLGQRDVAVRIHDAWLCTLEDGIHTADIYRPESSRRQVTTNAFANSVIENLDRQAKSPRPLLNLPNVSNIPTIEEYSGREVKQLVGVDVFCEWSAGDPEKLVELLKSGSGPALVLQVITNRGIKVWPDRLPEVLFTDYWRCRFVPSRQTSVDASDVVHLLDVLIHAGLDVVATENLYLFDGVPGFSQVSG